jgi:hypothetical protein
MRPWLVFATVVMLVQAPASKYVGTWTAELGGRTYVRLELKRGASGALEGQMDLARNVQVDARGEVNRVSEEMQGAAPLLNLRATNAVLSFSRKDGNDTNRFELRVTGTDAAELMPVLTEMDRRELAENNTPPIKALHLKRRALN